MKIAFISDAHGNYLALEEVLLYLKKKMKISEIYFLGDAVGYMPEGNKVISKLKNEAKLCLMGNHEAMMLHLLPVKESAKNIYKLDETQGTISNENRAFIEKLLPLNNLKINNYSVLMVHGSPTDPLNGYLYEDSDFDALPVCNYDFVFMGHTHRPYILKKENTTFVNVGSCGLPRDNGSLASFVVFDSESGQVNLYRLPLNIDAIVKKYKSVVDKSVIDCFMRANNYNGELVN